ncbi:hypothetical protein [Aquitalea magnusonii]|uniref:Ankyrin repeat protein n=1 Tax=Aquitalea magnusonii TaxID=332411 RepID=A0A318K8V8_9NEIS|nr:hypothetical protein [Aquitalea magnusonii]PXX51108.1 hypothetical protein DFR38_101169 [Aquitalea magnusonii]
MSTRIRALSSAISVALIATTPAMAGSLQDQTEVKTAKTELIIPGASAQEVADQIRDALSSWATPVTFNARSLPAVLPSRPDSPTAVQKQYGGTAVVEYQCSSAYAEIVKRPAPIKNPFFSSAEIIQICVYPFQKGVKAYVMYNTIKKTESLTSGLFNGIANSIRGNEVEWLTKQMAGVTDDIRKKIPGVLIARIEVPGQQVQEPDHDAVAGIIPAEIATVVPMQTTQPNTQITQAVTASKIEARKNLTAMGFSYHSQEQFITAIRRKDDVAVQLFMDGGGIDISAKDKRGKTPLDIAKEIGAPNLIPILSGKTSATVSTNPAATNGYDAVSFKRLLDEAQAQLPVPLQENVKTQMNVTITEARLKGINLSEDQIEVFRRQVLSMYPQIAAQINRINPATGRMD